MKPLIPEDLRGKTRSMIVVVCVGITLAIALLHLKNILAVAGDVLSTVMPFFIGFAIAFLLLPIVNRMDRLFNLVFSRRKPHPKLSRVLATIIAYIVLLTMLTGFFAILVPQLITSIKSILQYVANFVSMNSETINQLLLKYEFLSIEGEQLVIAWENVVSQLMNYTSVLLNNLMAISSGIYTMVLQLFVGMIAAFYLLMEKERFCAQIKKVCYATFKPATCERLIYWTRRANKIFAGFITGKILDSLIIGIICYICMLLFHIEYPLLISVIVGITNVIPFFGPFIGAVPSVLILLLVNPWSALWFGVFILILQQLDGNLIGPFILGDYVGLSPFWIMLSILIGSGLFGFTGMLLGVPVFALAYAIVRTIIDNRLKERRLPVGSKFYAGAPENLQEEKKK
ncbi:MAG: AI-2E family transporter [Clostridia bacterium]|nr:AI-2E family transporter [Clostridia bacterium]